ncbi:MAG: hypothetical protein MIO92_11115, partial [Methanosarcinaceae archaeon]|nr:hypothetical protein [Methanosarcinaceae archaeon]
FKQEISVMYYDSDTEVYREIDKLNQKEYTDYLENYLITALLGDYVSKATTLSVGSTAENIANTACRYRVNGTSYTASANAVGTAFTSADTINTAGSTGLYWGVWAVQINSSGTISTKSPSSNQVYTTEALAIAALPSADTDNVILGYVTVNSLSHTAWTAGTDDLTDGSDCTEANFYNSVTGVDNTEEYPLYYYVAPQSTTYRKIMFLPVPEEDKTDGIYIRHYQYLAGLADDNDTWDAYEDQISTEAPELLIWMAVKDLAMTQRDSILMQTASMNLIEYFKLFKSKDWNYKIANSSKIPYKDV